MIYIASLLVMESSPTYNQSSSSTSNDLKSPWPIVQPRPATYMLLFFLVLAWPGMNLLLLFPGQYEINYEVMDPVIFIFVPTLIIEWLILLVVLLVIWREKAAVDSVGLIKPRFVDIPIGIGFFIFAYIFVTILGLLLTLLGLPIDESVDFLVAKACELEWWWLVISITAAVCEEIAFRGFLITRLRAVFRGGWVVPILLSSLAFGAGHSYQGLGGFILLTILGVMLGSLFLVTRSLWPVIIAHFVIDISAIYIYKFSQSFGF